MSVLCSMLIPLLFSCVDGIKDTAPLDLTDVNHTQMVSPDASFMSVISSADGSTRTISWPFSFGAAGYEIYYYTLDVNEEIVDTVFHYELYDGTSIVVNTAEDTRYQFAVRTIGKHELFNTDAVDTTKLAFGTAYQLVHHFAAGENVSVYLSENKVPEVNYPIKYTFEYGAEYQIDSTVKFGLSNVMFCPVDVPEGQVLDSLVLPKLTFNKVIGFEPSGAPFKFKNLRFGYTEGTTNQFIRFATIPNDHPLRDGNGWVTILDPISIIGCTIDTPSILLADNNAQYGISSVYFDDCVISFAETSGGGHLDMDGNSVIKAMTFQNSTLSYTKSGNGTYFYRVHNNYGSDRNTLWTWGKGRKFYLNYCTFYRIAYSTQILNGARWGNNDGSLDARNNIFYDTGTNGGVVSRAKGNASQGYVTLNNTYWLSNGGSFDAELSSSNDSSGTAIQFDPLFTDPANGNFKLRGINNIGVNGDPRWW